MQPLRSVPNPERGCGTLKEGGFYARGDTGVGGGLASWVWALGDHIIGQDNLTISVPARQMQVINLPATLETCEMRTEPLDTIDEEVLAKLPPMALIDHIGSQYYTPYAFYEECRIHGPSRRIPQNIAKVIAQHTPIPIVFTHSWLPVVDWVAFKDITKWAGSSDLPQSVGKSWQWVEGWGLGANDYHGERHWIIPVLERMHEAGRGKEKLLHEIMPAPLYDQVLTTEQVFGISWITRCVYITSGDETDAELMDIASSGIEPVRTEEV